MLIDPPCNPESPLRLQLDGTALVANWRWLRDRAGGAACGAAVKANAYGLGAPAVVARLAQAGCRDFYVATWAEAVALGALPPDATLSIFHGVRPADMACAIALGAKPVLNSVEQVQLWKQRGGAALCDVMIDTGINRLGIAIADLQGGLLDGLVIDTVMSHLASADEDCALNDRQRSAFIQATKRVSARRKSLANSAGICLGPDYAFDIVRPGLALYGGVPRAEAIGHIQQVAFPEAEIVQVRTLMAGDAVGYNHQWVAPHDCDIAVLHIGYADGYLRAFSNAGSAHVRGERCVVVGRVSMDLIAVALPHGSAATAGDWVQIDFALPDAAAQSGLSQYELLTGLGPRFDRCWR